MAANAAFYAPSLIRSCKLSHSSLSRSADFRKSLSVKASTALSYSELPVADKSSVPTKVYLILPFLLCLMLNKQGLASFFAETFFSSRQFIKRCLILSLLESQLWICLRLMHAQKISLVKNIERLWCHYINSYSSNQLEEKGQGKEDGYQIRQT